MMGTIETHVFRSDMLFKTFHNGKEVTRPNTLLVQMMRTPKGTLVRIKGNKNPLPFKEAVITDWGCNILKWIEDSPYGYNYIGKYYM
jgi:hypothetical protein|nr:MAG TPA: hypothetical protein [Caudoviricetes sp.]